MQTFEVYGITFDESGRKYEPSKLITSVAIPDDGDEDCLLEALNVVIGAINSRDYGLGKRREINGVMYDIVLGPNRPVLMLRKLPEAIGNLENET